ncbi:MAG: hypothetical protein HDKAJFGB_01814 [Anaerolineae bacterium]|nr:hypothetical protein [Anaerolineae bacterium]RIK17610.1 MAG: hypothetical protein DCC52_16740 [Chloroflexota bacterium]
MKNKVNVEKSGYVHYYAQCADCDFCAAIQTQYRTAKDVLRAVRKHVRDTGHRVTIEAGKITHYERG